MFCKYKSRQINNKVKTINSAKDKLLPSGHSGKGEGKVNLASMAKASDLFTALASIFEEEGGESSAVRQFPIISNM